MKKIITLLLLAAMLLSLSACEETVKQAEFEFRMDSDGDYYILYAYNGSDKDVEIPRKYNGEKVKAIHADAFKHCSYVETVEIPDTVENISWEVFSDCTALEKIIVDDDNDKYSSEGDCLVNKDTGMVMAGGSKSVIPEIVNSISNYAFANREGLEEIDIPKNVNYIAANAFIGCTELEEVNLSDGVTMIDKEAFSDCVSLEEITIPSSVILMGDDVFDGCRNLETVYCEAESQPSDWDPGWLGDCGAEVVWGS